MSTQSITYQNYDSYKDSGVDWIGQIPDHWSVDYVTKYFSISKEKVSEGLVDALSVGYMGVVPQLENAAKNNAEGDRKLVRQGDIAINSRSDRMGAAGLSVHKGGVSLVYHVLRPKGKYEGKYYHHVYRNNMFSQEFYRQGGGIVDDLWSTKDSRLVRIKLPNPSEEEKKQIASFIDDKVALVDELISKKQTLIELLHEKRQAIITQAFTKGLDPKAKMKDSGIEWVGEIPDGWEIRKLKNLFLSHETGIWGEEENGNEDDVMCIRVADFQYDQLRISDGEKTLRNITKSDLYKKKLRAGDLLLEKSGGGEKTIVGRAVLFELSLPAVCANFIEFHRFNNLIYPKYGLYLFAALYQSGVIYKNIKQTTGIQNLDLTGLYSQLVIYPDIEIQKEIVAYLDSKTSELDLIRNMLKKQITKLQEFKSSVIYNAVTGKIKV